MRNEKLVPLMIMALGESKVEQEPLAQTGRAQPWYDDNMEKLGLFLLPLGRDASPSQGYLPAVFCQYPFTHLGGWRTSCPRKQPRDVPRWVCLSSYQPFLTEPINFNEQMGTGVSL